MAAARELGVLAEFRLRIGLFFVIAIVAVTLCTFYAVNKTYRAETAFCAAVAAGAAATYSAYYAGQSLRRNTRLTKMRNAYDLLAHIHTHESMQARTLFDRFEADAIKPRELHDTIVADQGLHRAVKTLLNAFEAIAIGVRAGYADEDIIYLNIGTLAPHVFRSFKPYVDQERRRYSDSGVFAEVENLIESWSRRKFLSTGKVIDIDLHR